MSISPPSVMYRSGRFIDLALNFLGQSQLHSLAPQYGAQCGLPDRERVRLSQFISGIKVTTPYCTWEPDRKHFIKRLTQESAIDRRFELGNGQTMSVADYFQHQLNIPLQYPELICAEVCTVIILSFYVCSQVAALKWGRHPLGALSSSARTAGPKTDSPRPDQFHTSILDEAPPTMQGEHHSWLGGMSYLITLVCWPDDNVPPGAAIRTIAICPTIRHEHFEYPCVP
jgi:hypothetical protein